MEMGVVVEHDRAWIILLVGQKLCHVYIYPELSKTINKYL